MLGYKCFNINILADNHEDLLYSQEEPLSCINELAARLKNLGIENSIHLYLPNNRFFIISTIYKNNDLYIYCLLYNNNTKKLYDSIKAEEFTDLFCNRVNIDNVVKMFERIQPALYFSENIIEKINNYQLSYKPLHSYEYDKMEIDDFEIDNFDDDGFDPADDD